MSSLLAAQAAYVQGGDSHFQSHNRDLARQMRAAARLVASPPLPDPDTVGRLTATEFETCGASFVTSGLGYGPALDLTAETFSYFLGPRRSSIRATYQPTR